MLNMESDIYQLGELEFEIEDDLIKDAVLLSTGEKIVKNGKIVNNRNSILVLLKTFTLQGDSGYAGIYDIHPYDLKSKNAGNIFSTPYVHNVTDYFDNNGIWHEKVKERY